MRRSGARRRYLRKHHPFPRFSFDSDWQAAIDALVEAYWKVDGRGLFVLSVNGRCSFTLPDGRVYVARLRKHLRKNGQLWFEGFVACDHTVHSRHDEHLNAEGALPEIRPEPFNLWPLQIKMSPASTGKDEAVRHVGLVWVGSTDGRPGGEVYRIVADNMGEGLQRPPRSSDPSAPCLAPLACLLGENDAAAGRTLGATARAASALMLPLQTARTPSEPCLTAVEPIADCRRVDRFPSNSPMRACRNAGSWAIKLKRLVLRSPQ